MVFAMADDSEAWPGREGRKRPMPAWMQEHENDSDSDVDEEEEQVRRAPKKPMRCAVTARTGAFAVDPPMARLFVPGGGEALDPWTRWCAPLS